LNTLKLISLFDGIKVIHKCPDHFWVYGSPHGYGPYDDLIKIILWFIEDDDSKPYPIDPIKKKKPNAQRQADIDELKELRDRALKTRTNIGAGELDLLIKEMEGRL